MTALVTIQTVISAVVWPLRLTICPQWKDLVSETVNEGLSGDIDGKKDKRNCNNSLLMS